MTDHTFPPLTIDRGALATELLVIADRLGIEAIMWRNLIGSSSQNLDTAARTLVSLSKAVGDPELQPDLRTAEAFAAAGSAMADSLQTARRILQ